jgi:hypothetical protein
VALVARETGTPATAAVGGAVEVTAEVAAVSAGAVEVTAEVAEMTGAAM